MIKSSNRIIITGGAGFIGSAVVRSAISAGYTVLNIDNLSYAGSLENVVSVSENQNYDFLKASITDEEAVRAAFFSFKPDSIIHLAAETHVDRSITGPKEFIDTNIQGTYNLLSVATDYLATQKEKNNFKFLHVSTDEVYGSLKLNGNYKFRETSPYDPRSPYAASKAGSDHLVRSWNTTYGLPTIISNCSNNFGPFQFPEKLIPNSILCALKGEKIPIYGTGNNVRDWLFVDDHVTALMALLKFGQIGESYNIGGSNEWSNIDLVQKLCLILDVIHPRGVGCYADQIEFVDDRPGHDLRYAVDTTKITMDLGWQPSTSFDSALSSTVSWYLDLWKTNELPRISN